MKIKNNEQPFNVYGIRRTANERYLSLSSCRSVGNEGKDWQNALVKAENVRIKDDYAYIKVKLLTPKKVEKEEKEEKNNELPF